MMYLFYELHLGGTGKESGDRHPKVREGVMIGGQKVQINIEIGRYARIGANSSSVTIGLNIQLLQGCLLKLLIKTMNLNLPSR